MSNTYTGIVRTYYDMEETKLKEEYFLVNGKKEGIKNIIMIMVNYHQLVII